MSTQEPAWQGTMREPYIEVEYDLAYWGGNYTGVGETAKIPLAILERCDGRIKRAFRRVTGLDPAHIIFYGEEAYIDDEDGEQQLWDE